MADLGISLAVIRAHRLELSRTIDESKLYFLPARAVQILQDYLSYLEHITLSSSPVHNAGEIQEILLEISWIIRSCNKGIPTEVQSGILERLNKMYSKGVGARDSLTFSCTAPDYAEVVEAISKNHPEFDYSEAIGQLLYYLNILYKDRKGSWKTVYDHLLSMSDSVATVKMLKETHLQYVHRWVEEGVQNLFDIRRDLQQRIRDLEQEVCRSTVLIEQQTASLNRQLESWPFTAESNVSCLDNARRKRALNLLLQRRDDLAAEQQDKAQVAELIDSNICEFELSLKEVRREFFMRQVKGISTPLQPDALKSLA